MTSAPTPAPHPPYQGHPPHQGPPPHQPQPPHQGQPPYQPQPPHPGQPAWPTVAPAAPRTSRLPSGAETLGWGGGLTTVVGVVAITWDLWSDISGLALVGLLAVATAVLALAAVVVGDLDRDDDDRLAANLSTGLWWMTGIAGAFCTYVATDVLSGGRTFLALLTASTAATAMFGAAAHRTRRDGLLAGTVASAAVAAFSAASLATLTGPARGLAVWVVGAAAVVVLSALTQPDPTRPRTRMAFAASLVVLYGGAQSVLWAHPAAGGAVIALVLLGSAIAAGAALWRRTTAEGVTAALVTTAIGAQVLYEIAPQVFSLPATLLLVGLVMTGACIQQVRRSARR